MKARKIQPTDWPDTSTVVSTADERQRCSCEPRHPKRNDHDPDAIWFSEHIRIMTDLHEKELAQ